MRHDGYDFPAPYRPGLPRVAAHMARSRRERLVKGEALLDAQAARPLLHADTDLDTLRDATRDPNGEGVVTVPSAVLAGLLDEISRLQAVETAHVVALAEAADSEARYYDDGLRCPLVRLDTDCYIAWVSACDAPTGWTMTYAEARDRGWTEKRILNAEGPDPDGFLGNRAGPGEKPLTVDAIREAFASAEAQAAFRLTPDKVACATTQDLWQENGEWQHGPVYWTPWPPDQVPATLPDGWADRF